MTKIINNLLKTIAIFIVLVFLVFDLLPNIMINTKIKLFAYIFAIFLVYIDMKIKNRKFQNIDKDENTKKGLLLIFIIYSILIATLLFLDNNYRLNMWNNIKLFSKEHFEYYSQVVPFRTILDYIVRYTNHSINTSIILTNIIGNIIVFAPYGILLPIIFKNKFNNLINFTILMFTIVFVVECTQFILMKGSFDVDDIILNILGSTITFTLMKIRILRNLFNKIID